MDQPTFWQNPENNIVMKNGVSPTCQQSFVSIAPSFVPLLAITSLFLLENNIFLKFTSGLSQENYEIAHFDTEAKNYTKSIVYMDKWGHLHLLFFFKETLNFKVSLKKTVINNLGKTMCKYNKIFCGSAVVKVS